MKSWSQLYVASLLGFFLLLSVHATSHLAQACDRVEITKLGYFEQCRWFRYDVATNTVRFCMQLKRLKPSIEPVQVVPYLKSPTYVDLIEPLEGQSLTLAVGECKTLCWQFRKPPNLDLSRFYEYTDFEYIDPATQYHYLVDYIWRQDRVAGVAPRTGKTDDSDGSLIETLPWPMFNELTKGMTEPMLVTTAVDMSQALPGWEVLDLDPKPGTTFTLYPQQKLLGTITIRKPANATEGLSIIQPRLLNAQTGEVVQEVSIRYLVDYTPPQILEATVENKGEMREFRVVASDGTAGLADAVQVHISVNERPFESHFLDFFKAPKEFDTFTMECLVFASTRTFTALLGPFNPNDKLQFFFTVPDEAGNETRTPVGTIQP